MITSLSKLNKSKQCVVFRNDTSHLSEEILFRYLRFVMNKVMLGLATASISTVAGGIALTYIAPELQATANAEAVNAQKKTIEQEVAESSGIKGLEASAAEATAIATTYNHEISGRSATTVYVRNIPVATFLGEKISEASEPKVATSAEELPIEEAKNIIASRDFVKAVNQFNTNDTDAETIGVKWDKEEEQYVIHIDDEPLLTMNGDVILPSTTKDNAEDALQITNRLRRQIGNVKPLKKIEGQPARKIAAAPTNVSRYQEGWASWYGPGFHGNLTADGTRYNQYGLTAAHRTLPFGTRLRVTNRNNGRSVVVVVNDRGPFIYDRVIDLSMGAAQVLGVTSTGVAPVTPRYRELI